MPPKTKPKSSAQINTQVQTVKKKTAPVSFGSSVSSSTAVSSAGNLRYRRTEFIADIVGSTSAFANQLSLKLNPGLSNFLPWLSLIANNFDMYRFHRLKFKYLQKTTTANKGEIDIAFDPDPSDPGPASLAQILNYGVKLSTDVWMDAEFSIPASDLARLPKYLTRDSVVGADLASYDIGQLFVIASGNVANEKVGQLWAEYDVELFTPQVQSTVPSPPRLTSVFTNSAVQNLVSGAATGVQFDTATFNPLGINVSPTGIITGLSGAFSVYCQLTVQSATQTLGGLTLFKNASTVVAAAYPPPLGNFSTSNLFAVVTLLPSDTIQIQVSATGTTLVAQGLQARILIIAPA